MALPEPKRPTKKLAVFCDGSWIGRETAVKGAPISNIQQLARQIGTIQYKAQTRENAKVVHPILVDSSPSNSNGHANGREAMIVAGYQEGVGVNRTFLEYLWDGATASDIGDECVNVYKFIVENYTSDHEIWLFGHSRGSFTIRCVAGMINNCGIIRKQNSFTEEDIDSLCWSVFRKYRSKHPDDAPQGEDSKNLKSDAERVWQVKRPIRFLGCIDTVGALGIPRLNAGIGFDWGSYEFFDQRVSSVVQHAWHAPCLHDRLWVFQPCLMEAGVGKEQAQIKQTWFPGTHYDVGNQTWRFIRQSPANRLEKLLGLIPDLLSRTVHPNQVLSNCVLKYMLEGVREVDENSENPLMPRLEHMMEEIEASFVNVSPAQTGSGDVYGNILAYAPAGVVIRSIQRVSHAFFSVLNHIFPMLGTNIQDLLGIKTIVGLLAATTDRRIPGVKADVFPYDATTSVEVDYKEHIINIASAANLGGKNETGELRYPSRTYEDFRLWQDVFGPRGHTHSDGKKSNGDTNGNKAKRRSNGSKANGHGKGD